MISRLPSGLPLRGMAPCFTVVVALAITTSVCGSASAAPKAVGAANKNAFNYFVAATKLSVDSKKIGYALSSTHDSRKDPDDRAYTDDEKAALVAENTSALKKLREGLKYPYLNPPTLSVDTKYPYYAPFRAMARLLELEAETRAARDDWAGSVDSCLDALALGEDIPHGSALVGALVGASCQALGRGHVWEAIDHLNADQAMRAAKRLERIQAGHCPYADTLRVEKAVWHRTVAALVGQPNWRSKVKPFYMKFASFSDGTSSSGGLTRDDVDRLFSSANVKVLDSWTPQEIVHNADAYYDEAIKLVGEPYSDQLTLDRVHDPVNALVLNGQILMTARLRFLDNQTQNSLLLVSLALRAYQETLHMYPSDLHDLVPKYLARVPADLFGAGAPLQYKNATSDYTLYSLGPDTVDDGGTPINNPPAPEDTSSRASLLVRESSKGDIVAGVNIY